MDRLVLSGDVNSLARTLVALSLVPFFPVALSLAVPPLGASLSPQHAGVCAAAEAHIHFDPDFTVACRDVSTPEFRELHPREMLVELQVQISSLIHSGREDDLVEYYYEFEFPERRVTIVDYDPKTEMTSDYAGAIGVEKKTEKTRSLGIGLSGSFEHLVRGTADAAAGNKDTTTVRYELVGEKESLTAAGTLDRGHSVYFKLKPSREVSLEGAKQFRLVLRVPLEWRTDYFKVHCKAVGRRRGVISSLDERGVVGGGNFLVSLYLAGDADAQQIARRFSHGESLLRHLAQQHRERIRENAYPSVAQKLGALLAMSQPKYSTSWLDELLYQPVEMMDTEGIRHLPQPVRRAAEDFLDAKQDIRHSSTSSRN